MDTNKPLIIERTFDAPVDAVWTAISDREAMKHWYFDMEGFTPEVGCNFGFTHVGATVTRVHLCQIKEIEKNRKISYSFRLGGNPGDSLVTFELFPEGDKTRLKLTHTGIETFADPVQEIKNFTGGWNTLINIRLVEYLSGAK